MCRTGVSSSMPREVWFTSDTHFGHDAIIKYCDRPFQDVAHMNDALIDWWNDVVNPNDIVWHLGDVGMGPLNRFIGCLNRLNGEKHLITGNHDEVFPGHRDSYKRQRLWFRQFESVQTFARRTIKGRTVLLSHFPYREDTNMDGRFLQYRLPNLGHALLHGHTHSTSQWVQAESYGNKCIHVGVDAWYYRPVHIDEIGELL